MTRTHQVTPAQREWLLQIRNPMEGCAVRFHAAYELLVSVQGIDVMSTGHASIIDDWRRTIRNETWQMVDWRLTTVVDVSLNLKRTEQGATDLFRYAHILHTVTSHLIARHQDGKAPEWIPA